MNFSMLIVFSWTFVLQVKINLELLEGIEDDLDFAFKLAKEESVLVLPGKRIDLKKFVANFE